MSRSGTAAAGIAGLLITALWVAFGAGAARAAAGGDLMLYGGDVTKDTGVAMAAGTSPSIAGLSGGGATAAFIPGTGGVTTYSDVNSTSTNLPYGLSAGSMPEIAGGPGGGATTAFNANGNALWTGNATGDTPASGAAVAAGTNPAIATSWTSSGSTFFFQGPGQQFTFGTPGSWQSPGLGMDAASSPAAVGNGSNWEAAFNANGNDLWTFSNGAGTDTGQKMAPTASPSITARQDGSYVIAFRGQDGNLHLAGAVGNIATPYPVAPSTNPSVASDNQRQFGYEIAFQGSNGHLMLYDGSTPPTDTGQTMAFQTSPAIASTYNGYEVAYQGAPAAPPPAPTTTSTTTATTPSTSAGQTTPVTQTTPTPPGTGSKLPQLRLRFAFSWTWTATTTRLRHLRLVTRTAHGKKIRIPGGTTISLACSGRGCPKLSKPKPARGHKRVTLAQVLATADGRSFRAGDLFKITVRAPGYSAEKVSARIRSGRIPRLKLGN